MIFVRRMNDKSFLSKKYWQKINLSFRLRRKQILYSSFHFFKFGIGMNLGAEFIL
jgi:hypothetical protein